VSLSICSCKCVSHHQTVVSIIRKVNLIFFLIFPLVIIIISFYYHRFGLLYQLITLYRHKSYAKDHVFWVEWLTFFLIHTVLLFRCSFHDVMIPAAVLQMKLASSSSLFPSWLVIVNKLINHHWVPNPHSPNYHHLTVSISKLFHYYYYFFFVIFCNILFFQDKRIPRFFWQTASVLIRLPPLWVSLARSEERRRLDWTQRGWDKEVIDFLYPPWEAQSRGGFDSRAYQIRDPSCPTPKWGVDPFVRI